MWTRPDTKTQQFQSLRKACLDQRILLKAAKTYDEAVFWSADYSINCLFSDNQLFASDSLGEIKDFLKIGGRNG